MTVAAVIVAGGRGERFGSPDGKQLALLAGRPMLAWTVSAFEACPEVDVIVIVAHPARVAAYADACASPKVTAAVAGGETRQESVAAGLAELPPNVGTVAVHDGARPLITPETIAAAFALLESDDAAAGVVVGHPVFDTLKRVSGEDAVEATVDRSGLWAAQTPQVFRLPVLLDAYERAAADAFSGTDDASLVERAGGRVRMMCGPRDNLKVTVPEDLAFAEAVLRARGRVS